MRVVMTGANGFIGRALTASLGRDVEVISLGRQPSAANHASVDLAAPGALAAAIAAGALPQAVDAVVHLAVSRLHRTFPATALDLFEVNVAATAHLLDYAHKAGAKHFVLGSTGSVYDGLTHTPLREADVASPRRYFPASKYAAEMLTREYDSAFSVAILRYFTPYGPGQDDRLIPGLIQRIKADQSVTLPQTGDGLAFAAIYLDDAVEIVRRALLEQWRGVFNAASPDVMTIRSAAEAIAEALGKTAQFERAASAPSYALIPDCSALQAKLGDWRFTPFAEGMRRAIAAL
jgi:UDP-glucose 4-epimerase